MKNHKFGKDKLCKLCSNEYVRNWKKLHKNRIQNQQKEMYQNNKGWYTKNRFRERTIELALKDRFRMRAYIVLSRIRGNFKKKSIPYDKTINVAYLINLFESNLFCNCCGVELGYYRKFDRKPYNNSPSINRFIPQKGYVKDNIHVLCWKCNNIKRNYTSDDLIIVAKWIKEISGNNLEVDIKNLIDLNTISTK